MGVLYGGSSCPQKMGWRVAVIAVLLCGSSQGRPSLLGAAGEDHHHHHEEHHHHEPHQAVDYSYSDYDYQPEEGRSLGAEDEYYEDITPARAYNFQFEGEEQSRQETQDEDGLVTGSYSYLGADGVQHTVNYRAGAGIGFEIIDPSVDQMFADFGAKMNIEPLPVAALRDAAPAIVVEAPAVAPDALYGAPAPVAPLETLYGAPAEELPSYAEELPGYEELAQADEVVEATTTGMMMDPSYYFQYKSADSERIEDADSSGSVIGSYSYLSPGGEEILVRYKAGAETGFVIENQEELNAALLRAASEPFEAAKEVEVKAASEPQEHVFTLEGDDEDVLPSPLSGAPPPLESLYSAPPPAPVAQPASLYGAPAPLEPLPSYEEEEVVTAPMMMMMDPSYNFAYTGDTGNREEASDSQGVVIGSYSYLSPEGNEILVRYTAGADTGFVIENSEELAASVREATDAGAEAAAARAVAAAPLPIGSSAASSDSVVISVPDSLYGAPAPAESLPSYHEEIPAPAEPLPSYQEEPAAPQMVMDASFSFAVDEEEHKFEEAADRAGERTGSYSYQAPDGTLVKVRYTAGRDGFVILNPDEVLPQAPQV